MQEQENTDGDGQTQASLFRAAQYVRMSTEHQQYSTENQADKIREYAARRGIEIIKSNPGGRTSRSSWSTTSAAGGASKMPTRVLPSKNYSGLQSIFAWMRSTSSSMDYSYRIPTLLW